MDSITGLRNRLRIFDTAENRMKVYLVTGILLFYIGDLYTTYINLQIGNIETNILFKDMKFTHIILAKTVLVISVMCMYLIYRNKEDKRLDLGIFLGAMLAMGFYVFFNNIGIYITTAP